MSPKTEATPFAFSFGEAGGVEPLTIQLQLCLFLGETFLALLEWRNSIPALSTGKVIPGLSPREKRDSSCQCWERTTF